MKRFIILFSRRGTFFHKFFSSLKNTRECEEISVRAMGPLGHIYLAEEPDPDEKRRFGRMLVQTAKIPLLLMPDGAGRVIAWNESGEFILPEDSREVVGRDHFYREVVTDDLVSVCHHPDAGTYIISGWRPGRKPLSFSAERGAHGGPGSVETDAFALLSPETPVGETARNYLSVGELRGAVLSFLEEMDFKHDGKS